MGLIRPRWRLLLRLCRLLQSFALALALSWTPAWAADTPPEVLRARVEQLRTGGDAIDDARIAARALIDQFYVRRAFEPVWDDARAAALRDLVRDSVTHGLDPVDYHEAALERLAIARDPLAAANRELLYTDALVRLVYHLHFGKVNPRELYAEWNFSRALGGGAATPVEALEALLTAPDLRAAVEHYAPHVEIYQALRRALAGYRRIAAGGGWPDVAKGPTLRVGMHDARVPTLLARLQASADADGVVPGTEALYDEALAAAVRRFQRRHGLEADGVLGESTRRALNVPVAARIDQLRVNLDRVRWVAQDLVDDFLLVDIAGFTARLYLKDTLVWSSRIVVGKPFRKTPAFRAPLRYIVLNPTWTVPPTILREDLMPKLVRDPDYLAHNEMQLVDSSGRAVAPGAIDWSRVREGGGFPYQVVQAPGATNPLGQLKFMLPNPYAIYLHDTPSRTLFERSARAFSSGCIRLERPRELAVLLIDDPVEWDRARLDAAIADGAIRTVMLKRQIPVLLLYFTAEADELGIPSFRPDLYGRDKAVLAGLAAQFRFSAITAGAPR